MLYKGKPLAGAQVIGDYVNHSLRVCATTNEQGFAAITIRNAGLNVIVVEKTEKLVDDPDADQVGNCASLSFTLPTNH